jgi:hypothetical protein
MRGKLAKKMRRMAEAYVKDVEKKPLGTGYRSYKQLENRIEWQPILDEDTGMPLLDPDGIPQMKTGKAPGTIYTEYLVRMIYHKIKKTYFAARRV